MKSSARVEAIGHLSRDAELQYGPSGTPMLKFSIGTHPRVKPGEPERTMWFDAVLFGKQGESLAGILTKGTPVRVRGDLDVRPWTARDGGQRTNLDIRVSELDLLGSRADRQGVAAGGGDAADDGGDLPF